MFCRWICTNNVMHEHNNSLKTQLSFFSNYSLNKCCGLAHELIFCFFFFSSQISSWYITLRFHSLHSLMGTQALLLRVGSSQLKLLPLLKNPWKGMSSWRAAWIPSPPRANWCVWSHWQRQRQVRPRCSTCVNLPQHPWIQTCPS